MVKAISSSILIVLLVGSSAFALGEIFQNFTVEGGLTGQIALPAGDGAGSLMQNLMLGTNQVAESVGTGAAQDMHGMLMQRGDAAGLCAGLTVDQGLAAISFGDQGIGGCLGLIGQGQGIAVIGTQGLTKAAGPGAADAGNRVFLHQDQDAFNVMGSSSENICLAGSQHSDVSGGPGAIGVVNTGIEAATVQTQTVGAMGQ
jgi:hypothetical protein